MDYWEEMRLRLMELEEELDASGIEDATEWEKFPEMERIMYAIAEHDMRLAEYPREQYEQDRARLIAEGVDPRCIMSYSACIAYDEWQAELEREREIEEAYDEWQRECAITAEVAERDEVIELAELAHEASMIEFEQLGCIGFDTALSDAEWNETSGEFWEFAVDLHDEPRAYVLTELF